ncbi:predicted protein [Naegleria gruberi]|uniref:Predicted protein n=1 Tax=Naegleria gruberi TaxID=5762 RepID=D2VXW6_NAEGR|nr:uncharacterized protein NAEGRDRAFT_53125 [Naegleria gruberi]EFC38411.1 predicted protein [Naegleria gruberi]|eukprot:XP_002671155.1 predicted protein [Naegleria gruberi strain NEG-M]
MVLVAKINDDAGQETVDQKSFPSFVYDQLMTTKSANQKKENTIGRISNVFTFGKKVAKQVEFEFKAQVTGDWQTYSKKFNEIVGSFSKVEDKPILYEIGKEFFFDKRDATASLNGYLYQVDLALSYWIDTLDDPSLCVMIEFGEDVAVLPIRYVNEIEDYKSDVKSEEGQSYSTKKKEKLVFDQAKLYKEMIAFNSDCICDIFLNYFTTEARSGKNNTITYRFTTSTTIENLQVWKRKGEAATKMLKDMIEQHDKKRTTNSTKIRYKRESEDWAIFVNYCRNDWSKAVEKLSKVEFIEMITPEKLSEIIEAKLRRHLGHTNSDVGRLRNQLFGIIKSQLLENRGNNTEQNPKMLHPQKLRQLIDEEIRISMQTQQLLKENEELKREIERLKKK